jgi:ATP-dependent RNA helicase SUPV3L1/SUV3
MPLMLKPAPTRLRLVLWSLANGLGEFPEAPPPGLVTVPSGEGVPQGYHAMSGYRAAGERAIRIDMLERLADMLRAEDSRGGFEANPDMLSITGMTLEQFADLMKGLGYNAERGERAKVKPAPAEGSEASEATSADAQPAEAEAAAPDATASEAAEPEMDVYFTFTWGGNRGARQQNRGGGKPRRDGAGGKGRHAGKPGGKPGGKSGGKPRQDKAKSFQARPPKKEKAIDPDNPFAALMALKEKN